MFTISIGLKSYNIDYQHSTKLAFTSLYIWLKSSYCVHVYVRGQGKPHFQCLFLPRGTNPHLHIAQKTRARTLDGLAFHQEDF